LVTGLPAPRRFPAAAAAALPTRPGIRPRPHHGADGRLGPRQSELDNSRPPTGRTPRWRPVGGRSHPAAFHSVKTRALSGLIHLCLDQAARVWRGPSARL